MLIHAENENNERKRKAATAFVFVLLAVLCVISGGVAEAGISIPEMQEETRKYGEELVAEWKVTYQKEGTWDLPDSSDKQRNRSDAISKDAAIALAIQTILDNENIEISFFEQYRPYVEYQAEEAWGIAISPKPMDDPVWAPVFFVVIEDGTGEVLHYNRRN